MERSTVSMDRISQLPNELIHVILSFLDAKAAVQTGKLSTRWKPVWKSLPHLNFERAVFRDDDQFNKFVRHVLSQRDKHSGISTINFVSNSISIPHFRMIMTYALSHNAQQVKIREYETRCRQGHHKPITLNSPILEQLSLGIRIKVLGTHFDCPALKLLHLKGAEFQFVTNDAKKSIDLFSQLFNLRDLTLTDCSYRGLEVFNITSCGLETLAISNTHTELPRFVLAAPNLTSFTCISLVPLPLATKDLHCLEKVNLHIHSPRMWPVLQMGLGTFIQETITMFSQLSSTKFLRISLESLKYLYSYPEMIKHESSPFCNLKHLELVQRQPSVATTIRNDAVIYLLNRSPGATVTVVHE